MNIEKNKPFLLKISNFEEDCVAMIKSKDNKDFLLVTLNHKRIFKICLNEKNESECYDSTRTLSSKTKETIINSLNTLKPNYCHSNFNYDLFFSDFEPLKIKRNEIQYSLCVEEEEDYLINNDWIAKKITIKSNTLSSLFTVFIYRELNKIVYSFLQNHEKIAKFVFIIKDNYLTLVRYEIYDDSIKIDFNLIKNDFKNLTTTSHEMQKDMYDNNKISNEIYKNIFTIID
jgi:hypothetical protein